MVGVATPARFASVSRKFRYAVGDAAAFESTPAAVVGGSTGAFSVGAALAFGGNDTPPQKRTSVMHTTSARPPAITPNLNGSEINTTSSSHICEVIQVDFVGEPGA